MTRVPASIRYHNPGAMWGNKLAIKWGAEPKAVMLNDNKGQGNNIAVFPDFVHGICAQLDLWRTSPNYKNKRFADAIDVWSGHNEVESYIRYVLARVPGMTRDTVMNDAFWRSARGIEFLKAQAGHEAGVVYPAPTGDWLEAQNRVFGSAPIPPADIPAEVKPARDTKWLQQSLNYLGADPQLDEDGIVGPLLRQEIRDFQSAQGLDPDGLVGPATLNAIEDALSRAHPEIILPPPGKTIDHPIATTFWGRVADLFRPKGNV